ncbi:MAG: DUF177 domain-containing protein [Bdellovibrionales bacterium]|nr:DUF177 domain-containing protein [Bdellovibrionales bacterium]
MIIRITDIPPEGRTFEFELEPGPMNDRVNAGRQASASKTTAAPEYLFLDQPKAKVLLTVQGSSVHFQGTATARFRTPCSRCAEDLDLPLDVTVNLVLKPRVGGARPDDVEDLGYGYYEDQEVDCGAIIEEHLILALPYVATCDAPTVEQCSRAQQALGSLQRTDEAKSGDERFAILRNLRLDGDPNLN